MYANDWLASESVTLMDARERGVYIQLLNRQFAARGRGLPPDATQLARLAGVSAAEFAAAWPAVAPMFPAGVDGMLHNPRMVKELAIAHGRYSARAAGGSRAAERTAHVPLSGTAAVRECSLSVPLSGTKQGGESESESDSSKEESKRTPPAAGAAAPKGADSDAPKAAKRFAPPTVDDVTQYAHDAGLSMDSLAFVDYWQSCGWRMGSGKPMRDWQAAARNWARRETGNGQAPRNRPLAWSEVAAEAAAKARAEAKRDSDRRLREQQERDRSGDAQRQAAQQQEARDRADMAAALADTEALNEYRRLALPNASILVQTGWTPAGPGDGMSRSAYLAWWRKMPASRTLEARQATTAQKPGADTGTANEMRQSGLSAAAANKGETR